MRLLVVSNIGPPNRSVVTYYDPATSGIGKKQQIIAHVFTPTASLITARYLHSATLLNDGRVLMPNNANSQAPPASSSTMTITITGTSSDLQHSTKVPLTLQ
jgi:hypothetical protein